MLHYLVALKNIGIVYAKCSLATNVPVTQNPVQVLLKARRFVQEFSQFLFAMKQKAAIIMMPTINLR